MKLRAWTLFLMLLSVCTATARDFTVGELLATPRQFNGKRVAVTGYYVAANEESSLFTTRAAAKQADLSRSIWVEFRGTPDVTSVASHYARLVGTFHYRHIKDPAMPRGYGHFGVSETALLDVASFVPLR